jgi:hypothetical protein
MSMGASITYNYLVYYIVPQPFAVTYGNAYITTNEELSHFTEIDRIKDQIQAERGYTERPVIGNIILLHTEFKD